MMMWLSRRQMKFRPEWRPSFLGETCRLMMSQSTDRLLVVNAFEMRQRANTTKKCLCGTCFLLFYFLNFYLFCKFSPMANAVVIRHRFNLSMCWFNATGKETWLATADVSQENNKQIDNNDLLPDVSMGRNRKYSPHSFSFSYSFFHSSHDPFYCRTRLIAVATIFFFYFSPLLFFLSFWRVALRRSSRLKGHKKRKESQGQEGKNRETKYSTGTVCRSLRCHIEPTKTSEKERKIEIKFVVD